LRERGIALRFQPVTNERLNVVATIPGRDATERMLFVAHIDTVPIADWDGDTFPQRAPLASHTQGRAS